MRTEIELSEEIVRYETAAQQAIFEMLPSGVLVADREGAIQFHNRAAEEILGSGDAARGGPSEWSRGFGWYLPDKATLLSPEELPLQRALRGDERQDELLFICNAHQPAGLWIRVTTRAIRGANCGVVAATMVLRDVTEGRLTQQTSTLLSEVVEQIADGVLLTDKHGLIEYVNPAFETMTGFSQREVVGKTPRILNSGSQDVAFYRRLWSELLAGRPFRAAIANRKKTGEIYHVEETITPITDEAGNLTHFVAVMQDITEDLNRQEREVQLRLARQIQQRFYRAAPCVPGFDVGASAYPAYETSGDYFDFISLPHDRLGIAVGDVEGHGFGSALVMALTRAYVHSFAAMGLEVDQILTQVNRMLVGDLGDGCFVTLMLASLDVTNRSLVFAGAGHVPGYVLSAEGEIAQLLESSGPPLGLFSQVRVTRSPAIELQPGQLVALFTDGLTEAMAPDGRDWGARGALGYLRAHRQLGARELTEGMYRAAREFAGQQPQKDDITSVVIKVASS